MEKTSLKLVFLFSLMAISLCSYLADAREMVEGEVNCLGGSCMPAPVAATIEKKPVCAIDDDCKVACPPDCRSDSPCVCACNGGNCTCECNA